MKEHAIKFVAEDPMNVRSILLVEASPIFRTALTSILSRISTSVTLYGQSRPVDHESGEYDAVIVDVATFTGDDRQLGELIQKVVRLAPVLLLAREDRIDQVIICFKAGAAGLVRQTSSKRNLRNAICAVASGTAWCDGQIFKKLTRYLLPVSERPEATLTKREEEVLQCLAHGQANKEIAACLAISQQSVKVYVSNLLRKLGVPNRSWLALHGMARGTEVY
jgi:DNA-binding NarL/FixJ family response regulator